MQSQHSLDLAAFRKSRQCDLVGTVEQLRHQLARIRGLDQKSQMLRNFWSLFTIGGTILCIVCSVGADNSRMRDVSMFFAAAAVASFALGLTMWLRARRTDFENDRYETADQLLGSLVVPPTTRLRLFLVLSPAKMDQKRQSHGVAAETYTDPWLSLEGQSASGLGFRLGRTTELAVSRTTRYSGQKRIDTTTESNNVDDTVAYTFHPGSFPQAERCGPHIAHQLRLAVGQRVQHVVNQQGTLSLTIRSSHKWDPKRAYGDTVDGTAALLGFANNLGQLLGQPPLGDANRRAAMSTAQSVAASGQFGRYAAAAIVLAVLAMPSALAGYYSYRRVKMFGGTDFSVQLAERECARWPASSPAGLTCHKNLQRTRLHAKERGENASEARIEILLYVALTLILLAGAAGLGLHHLRLLRNDNELAGRS